MWHYSFKGVLSLVWLPCDDPTEQNSCLLHRSHRLNIIYCTFHGKMSPNKPTVTLKISFLHAGKPIASLPLLLKAVTSSRKCHVGLLCLDAGVVFTPKYQQQHAVKPMTCGLRHEFVYLVFCSLRWHTGPRPVSRRQSTGDRDTPPLCLPPGATRDEKEHLWYFPKDLPFSILSQQYIKKKKQQPTKDWMTKQKFSRNSTHF